MQINHRAYRAVFISERGMKRHQTAASAATLPTLRMRNFLENLTNQGTMHVQTI